MWPLKVGTGEGPLKDVVSVVTLNLLCLSAAFEGSLRAEKEIVVRAGSQGIDKGKPGSSWKTVWLQRPLWRFLVLSDRALVSGGDGKETEYMQD